jgi:hypothetical protein
MDIVKPKKSINDAISPGIIIIIASKLCIVQIESIRLQSINEKPIKGEFHTVNKTGGTGVFFSMWM